MQNVTVTFNSFQGYTNHESKRNFREFEITKRRIEKILKAGANVVLTTGGIDDLCLKQFVEAGAMAVRRCKKIDLKRISKATGGSFKIFLIYITVSIYTLFFKIER